MKTLGVGVFKMITSNLIKSLENNSFQDLAINYFPNINILFCIFF